MTCVPGAGVPGPGAPAAGAGVAGAPAGRVILVCGAASGIGAAAARRLAGAGARVVLAGRRADAGEAIAGELRGRGAQAHFLAADLTEKAGAAAVVSHAVSRFGRLDGAFNNVGDVTATGPLADLDLHQWGAELDVNLTSVWLGLKYQLPAIQSTAGRGSVLNYAAVGGVVGVPGMAAYVAAKHAVVGLTRAAALEYADAGVRVNALVTGTVDTPLLRRLMGAAPSGEPVPGDVTRGLNPLGRLAAADEIAAFAEFLLSDDAAFITGAALSVAAPGRARPAGCK